MCLAGRRVSNSNHLPLTFTDCLIIKLEQTLIQYVYGAFTYKWTLYSAGHADLDINKEVPKEDMVRNRDRENTWLLGDSGGFQIGKGVWEGDWKDPNCPKAQKKRDGVLRWMDAYMDYGMILDIPAWVSRSPEGAKATGISTYAEAVAATRINNDYFMKHRTGACKFLNVHPGLLPFYRGQNPVQWSVRDLAPLGATVHFIDEGIDTGPILLKKELINFKSKSIRNLRIEVLEFSASLLVE